jgi:hypothetical protein
MTLCYLCAVHGVAGAQEEGEKVKVIAQARCHILTDVLERALSSAPDTPVLALSKIAVNNWTAYMEGEHTEVLPSVA